MHITQWLAIYSTVQYCTVQETVVSTVQCRVLSDLEKTNSMNSAEFNFLKDYPPTFFLFFPPNLAP